MSGTGLDRWTEARETLTELIEWLDDARQWAETTAPGQEPTDEEARHAAQAFAVSEPPEHLGTDRPPLDLHVVVAELTALRQEVKLQTRTARQDRELAAKTVEELSGALDQLERWRADESVRRDAAVAEARRGTAELLVDLHDALSRSFAEADRVVRTTFEALGPSPAGGPIELQSSASSFGETIMQHARTLFDRVRRWRRGADVAPNQPAAAAASLTDSRGTDRGREENHALAHNDPTAIARRLEGVTDGYALALRRIERALAEFEIEPIEAVGRAVDPELMEVVQSIRDAAQPPGTVVAEVRRGYRRQGRVMRFAQVVVNRGEG